MTSQISPNSIDPTFPVAGVDNDTQGFRQNFANIVNNFQQAATEITTLQNSGIFLGMTNDLTGTTLANGTEFNTTFKGVNFLHYDFGGVLGEVAIDLTNGNSQQLTPTAPVTILFTNWPATGHYGFVKIRFVITNINYSVTLPSNVTPAMSFTQTGIYDYEFTSVDNGTTIQLVPINNTQQESEIVSLWTFLSDAQVISSQNGSPVDCTSAIQSFFSQMVTGGQYYIPAGQYLFLSALTIPAGINNFKLFGDGKHLSQFVYSGISITIDLLTIGANSSTTENVNTNGVNISGIMVRSNTAMAAGYALRFNNLENSYISDISNGASYTRNTWNGIFFNGAKNVFLKNFEISAQNTGGEVRGVNVNSNSNLSITEGFFNSCGYIGLHCSGGFHGFFVDNCQCSGNIVNVAITNYNQSTYSIGNSRIVFGPTSQFDGGRITGVGDGMLIDDTSTTNVTIDLNGITASSNNGIHIKNWPNSRLIVSGSITNNIGNGIHCEDATTIVSLSSDLSIDNNGGWGVYSTVSTSNYNISCYFDNNTLGAISSNVGFTIATLPTAGTIAKGAIAMITDAVSSPPRGGIVSATGTTSWMVFCDGVNWLYL